MLWSTGAVGSVAAIADHDTATVGLWDESGMDESAFRELYSRTARPLWGYLARATGSRSLADDLLQETYFRMLRARFEPDSDDHARNFLFKVATNLVRDHYRSPRRDELPLAHSPTVAGPEEMIRLRQDVGRGLQQLRPRERQLLWLAHVEQFSHREIAGIMGLKAASVRLLLFRARKRLATVLTAAGAGPEAAA